MRDRAEELLAEMERTVRGLGTTLQDAEGSVAEVERALSLVRSEAVGRLPTGPPTPAPPTPAPLAPQSSSVAATVEQTAAQDAELVEPAAEREPAWEPGPTPMPEPETVPALASGPHGVERTLRQQEDSDQRPLGWLFRSTRP